MTDPQVYPVLEALTQINQAIRGKKKKKKERVVNQRVVILQCVYIFFQSFAYYGSTAILVLYFDDELGFSSTTSTALVHYFLSTTFFFTILGGLIADYFAALLQTIVWSLALWMIGTGILVLSSAPGLNLEENTWIPLIGLAILAIGKGALTPANAAIFGLELQGCPIGVISSGFTWFIFAISFGSLFSKFIIPELRSEAPYHYFTAFACCLVCLGFGLVALLWDRRSFRKQKKLKKRRNAMADIYNVIKTALFTSKESYLNSLANPRHSSPILDDVNDYGASDPAMCPQTSILPSSTQSYSSFSLPVPPPSAASSLLQSPISDISCPVVTSGLAQLSTPPHSYNPNESLLPSPPNSPPDSYSSASSISGSLSSTPSTSPHPPSIKFKNGPPQRTRQGTQIPMGQNSSNNYQNSVGSCSSNTLLIGAHPEEYSFLDKARISCEDCVVNDVKATMRVFKMFLPLPIFWCLFYQTYTTWTLQAQDMNLNMFGVSVSADMVQGLNPLFDIALIPLFNTFLYPYLRNRWGFQLLPLSRLVIGMLLGALSFLFTGFLQGYIEDNPVADDGSGGISVAWQIPQYFILSVGEVLVNPAGLEFANSQAPISMKTAIQALWYFMVGIGNLLIVAIELFSICGKGCTYFFYSGLMALFTLLFAVISHSYNYRDIFVTSASSYLA